MHVAWLEASLQEAEKNRLHAAGQTDHLRSAANVFEETWRRLEPEIPRDVRESFVFPDWGTAKENWIKWYGVSVGGDRYDRKWYEIAQEMKQTLDPLKDALGRVDPRVATWVPTHYPDSAS